VITRVFFVVDDGELIEDGGHLDSLNGWGPSPP
jgi:hypothetical protein